MRTTVLVRGVAVKYDDNDRLVAFGDFPTLETARLTLREMNLDDDEFYLSHCSDPVVVDMMARDAPATIDLARRRLSTYCIDPFRENTGIRWGIETRDERKLIGTIGYHDWVKERGYNARMGYDLMNEYRNKGLMTEAMTAAVEFGFTGMRLNRIVIHIDRRNLPSQALARKLGFTYEGTLRENAYFHGRFLDDMVFSMLAKEWRRP